MKTLILVLISFCAIGQVKQKSDTAKLNKQKREYLAKKAKIQAMQDSIYGIKADTVKKQPAKKDND